MERIFSYTDHEKDLTEVWAESNEDLVIKNTRHVGRQVAAVRMGSADARLLRDALNYWLGDPAPEAAPEPVYGPDSLIGQLIAQAVSAEVARALKQPQAIPECIAQTNAPEDDPEPHDVGHPVYEDARPHLVDVPAPRQTVPVGPMYCEPCGHHRNEHMGVLGGCWGSLGSCECTNNPDAPVPVTKSDKVWGEQGQAPKPVALECICDKHNHRPVDRPGSPATCVYRDCECRYRSAP